jgi:uncharacterized protein (TIGR03437 family)
MIPITGPLTPSAAPTANNNNGYNAQGTSPTDRVLATAPTGYSGSALELDLINASGSASNGLTVSYDIYEFTVATIGGDPDPNELPGYQLFYSLNGGAWVNVASLNPTILGPDGVIVPNTVGVTSVPSTTIAFGAAWQNGQILQLRWVDDNATQTSPDQIIGLDNVVISLAPGPVITSVLNNYSSTVGALPNSGIAQGSLFVIAGTGLADPTKGAVMQDSTQGLPTTLNGSTVQVTSGGTTVTPAFYYASSTQLAVVLPSNTPLGTAQITVSYNGQTSPPYSLQVVQAAFGFASFDGTGTGLGAALNVQTLAPYTNANSIPPGTTVELYGSGLGADAATDTKYVGTPFNIDGLAHVFVGGIDAPILYQGSGYYPGLNQINVTIPLTAPTGCNVPVAGVSVAGIQTNLITLPIGNGPCSDPALALATGAAPQQGYAVGNTIPDFTSFDQYGIARSVREYLGEYVLLDMCALWCYPCNQMSLYAAGDRATLRAAGVPFEYLTVMVEGALEGSQTSTRAEAESWAFQGREDSPVFSNPYQTGVPSSYGVMQTFQGFTAALQLGEDSYPTLAVLGPNQTILWEGAGGYSGQSLLNLFTKLGIGKGLVSPPIGAGTFDSVNLQMTVNGERLSADVPVSSLLSPPVAPAALGGSLHLTAAAASGPFDTFYYPGPGGSLYIGLQLQISTDRAPCMEGGGSNCPPDYLPGNMTLQLGDWQTLRYGQPREVGVSFAPVSAGWPDAEYLPEVYSQYNAFAINDPLFAAGPFQAFNSFYVVPFSNAALDQGLTPSFGLTGGPVGTPGGPTPSPVSPAGPSWFLQASIPLLMLPPGVRMESMIAEITNANLPAGTAQPLTDALSQAIPAMSPSAQGESACGWMASFSGLVYGATAAQIPQALAQRLLVEAARTGNLLGCPVSVPTSGSTCNGLYNGTFNGDLTVSSGQNCVLVNGGVSGNVTVNGGNLVLTQAKVAGNVQITEGGTFNISSGTTIGGSLQIQDLPNGPAQNQVCGSTVNNDVSFQNNGVAVLIGAAASASCAGNTIGGNLTIQNNAAAAGAVGNTVGGNLTVQNNSASTIVNGNTVNGNLQVQDNTAPTQVFTNIVGANLQCQLNSSITGGGNTAQSKQGQCGVF